ncbi:MAG TPA: hypothetical protein VJR49_04730 [Chthoniobacterales bacterium]|nr:hypothetical protein [Chthoniobacterales bacterium]
MTRGARSISVSALSIGLARSGRATSVLFAGLIFLCACSRSEDEIKVYRLVKPSGEPEPVEKDAVASTNAPVKSTLERVPTPAGNVPVPANWEPRPLSEMRQASFLVKGENGAVADISLVKLGPAAGNVLENVNRWLGQLGQPPVTPEKLTEMIQKLPTARGDVEVVDLNGKPEDGDASKDGRIIGAIASDEGTSFFKMRGNAALVGTEKEKFLKWVAALRAGAGTEPTAMPQLAAPTSNQPQIKWDVPPDWSPGPASAMRYASFATSSDNVDISVVTFPGDGGDDLGNINRWRQQLGLPPADANASNIVPLQADEATFSTIDIVGANARTVVAWTRKNDRAWFFKLTGPNDDVAKEKPNFVKFVQSVRF